MSEQAVCTRIGDRAAILKAVYDVLPAGDDKYQRRLAATLELCLTPPRG